jgi:hypothetical protein
VIARACPACPTRDREADFLRASGSCWGFLNLALPHPGGAFLLAATSALAFNEIEERPKTLFTLEDLGHATLDRGG